ncbi:MAG: Bax inhibitor-1/YccA family membrane protein [Candidatus Phytoplasma pruni]|uniref:Bax inhibitor-1/YccA family membrane protein n=1 Tax=Milkweed yellows phytoplasma TaxID=208434 RepID=UPI000474F798|nr:Bax inhibitor-1/YccA family protein [Milkweed yellows phytoplasma]
MQQKENVVFRQIREQALATNQVRTLETATKKGVATKTMILLLTVLVSGILHFSLISLIAAGDKSVKAILLYSSIGVASMLGFVSIMVSIFAGKMNQKPFAIMYAISEGILISGVFGSISVLTGAYSAIVSILAISVIGTLVVFLIMHFLYYQEILKVNNKFRISSLVSFIVILAFLTINMLVSFISGKNYLSGYWSQLAISGVLLVLGSAFLAIDFDNAEQIMTFDISKKYEWSLAFAFLTTLIFIFEQIARILILTMLEKKNNEII